MDSSKRLIGIAFATIAGAPSRLPGKAWARHATDAMQGYARSTRRFPTNQARPSSRLVMAGRARAAGGALLTAERLRPDVIVADLALVQSGLDLIRKLRAKADEAQLIVITSHEDSNVEVAVRAAGADCVVVKRAIATDLLPAIDHMRARRTLHSPTQSPNGLGRS